MQDLNPSEYGEADLQAVDPPVEVQVATWSAAGTLDWWVRERREWFGRVRGPNGRQRWIKAADLRPVEAWCLAAVSSAESQRCENLMVQAGIDP